MPLRGCVDRSQAVSAGPPIAISNTAAEAHNPFDRRPRCLYADPLLGRIGSQGRIRLRLGGAYLRLKRVELGRTCVDLALQSLKLLLGGRRVGLSLGESPMGGVNLSLKARLLGRQALVLALHRGGPVAFFLEPGVDGLQIARFRARLLLRA
jgi:hypothetical protein